MISVNYSKNFIMNRKRNKILSPNNVYVSICFEKSKQMSEFLLTVFEIMTKENLATVRIKDMEQHIKMYYRYFVDKISHVIKEENSMALPELIVEDINFQEAEKVFGIWGLYTGGAEIYFCDREYFNKTCEYVKNKKTINEDTEIYKMMGMGYMDCIMRQGLNHTVEIILRIDRFEEFQRTLNEYIISTI